MKRKSVSRTMKEIKRRKAPGTPVLGFVNLQYVQWGLTDYEIENYCEALKQQILSDYYRQTLGDRSEG